jgi:5-methyltetrahydropteroyltriglutamate--homocysteine methyltransferase
VSNGQHPLRAAVEDWRGRVTPTPASAWQDAALREVQAETQAELLATQAEAGVDIFDAGYVPVYDEWFQMAHAVADLKVAAPLRYLDTNTYYHHWVLDHVSARQAESPIVSAYRHAASLAYKPIKPALFGPYTIWAYADRQGEGDSPAAFAALVDMWATDAAALAAAGARYIQIEESVVLRPKHRADFPMVAQAVEQIASAAPDAIVILHLACGAAGDLLEPLLAIPGLGGLGLDFTDAYRDPNLAALNDWHGDAILQAGIADSRSIRIETEAELHETLTAITATVPVERCWAAPSTALLYLPRHAAFEKLTALAKTAHAFDGVGEST